MLINFCAGLQQSAHYAPNVNVYVSSFYCINKRVITTNCIGIKIYLALYLNDLRISK